MTHPITPPPALLQQWRVEAANRQYVSLEFDEYIAEEAAQYGADQELEACVKWLEWNHSDLLSRDLRAARRKPPSLKEQALEHLEQIHANAYSMGMGFDSSIIRRALETLPE